MVMGDMRIIHNI